LAGWHFIALNSNCNEVGCDPGSPQQRWLRADLDAHSDFCTLAYWHHPRFSSGSNGNEGDASQFWEQLHKAGADIVLNAHDHGYERFAPQDPDKRPDPSGIREFVVGTGGEDLGSFDDSPDDNSEIQNSDTFGVLELTLHPTTYEWSFVPTSEGSFVDSGTGECH
ncbi:MAG: alkaline phosphatase, partial [Actinobacteria bacterium]|nr:alkaline phosphatase [Actinomycetota bacterium]